MKRTLTTCPYCGTGCGFYLLSNEDNMVTAVEPSTAHPVSKGQLCVKGWNAYNFVNHTDRLKTPQVRENGKLVNTTWNKAFDFAASKLKEIAAKYGPDSIMFFASAKTSNEENYLLQKFARAVFKTNNIDHCARL